MEYLFSNKLLWFSILVLFSTIETSFSGDLPESIETAQKDVPVAELQFEDQAQTNDILENTNDVYYKRKLIPNSINEQSDSEQQLFPIPDESLAVDGDVVRTDYRPSLLDTPRVATSNVTINANLSSAEGAVNATSFRCTCITGKENGGQPVELVNSTRLVNILTTEPNVTNRKTAADCVALMFYAQYCSFSAAAAPHFNALPRAFPDIKMAAVDAMRFHSFNTQYGIVGVPTIMLFHNGRPVAKFNDSEYTLELFAKFITKNTGIEPDNKLLYVLSADFGGPVSSVPTKETDYCLVMSWIFIIMCGVYFFSKSAYWKWIVETTQNTWREAEAQHEHAE